MKTGRTVNEIRIQKAEFSASYEDYKRVLEMILHIKFKRDSKIWETWEVGTLLTGCVEEWGIQKLLETLSRSPAAVLIQMLHKFAVCYNFKDVNYYLRSALTNRKGKQFCLVELIHLYVITKSDNRKRSKFTLEENCSFLDALWGREDGEFLKMWHKLMLHKLEQNQRVKVLSEIRASIWDDQNIQNRSRLALKKAKKELIKQLGTIKVSEMPSIGWPDNEYLRTIRDRGHKSLGKGHMFPIEYTFEANLFRKG